MSENALKPRQSQHDLRVQETPVLDRYPSRVSLLPKVFDRLDPVVYGQASDGPLDADSLDLYEENG
ncbi:MAG: hypothetical protein WAO93_09330, partial [Orrella sp.]